MCLKHGKSLTTKKDIFLKTLPHVHVSMSIIFCICICYFCTCSWELCNWKKVRAWREKETYLWKYFCTPQFVIFLFHVYFVFVTFVFVFGNFATGRWGPDIFVKTFLRTFICNLGQHRHHDSILRMLKSVSLTEILSIIIRQNSDIILCMK